MFAAMGYRRTSNAFGILSRVDREDWKEHMARLHSPWNHAEGREWANLPGLDAADFYRRVHSKDKVTVPKTVSRLVPTSGHDPIGFVPLPIVDRSVKPSNIALVDIPDGKGPE